MNSADVRRAIVQARASRQWSQTDLARAAGVNKSTVNEIESGQRSPHAATLARIAHALDLDLTPAPSPADTPNRPPASPEIPNVTDPQIGPLLTTWQSDPALRALISLWPDLTAAERHRLASTALGYVMPDPPAVHTPAAPAGATRAKK